MKTLVLVACILCTAAAFGQATAGAGALSSQPQRIVVPSHPERAVGQSMANSESLLGHGGYTIAHGERPLWEVAPDRVEKPLGDQARELKQERITAKKAKRVWEN